MNKDMRLYLRLSLELDLIPKFSYMEDCLNQMKIGWRIKWLIVELCWYNGK